MYKRQEQFDGFNGGPAGDAPTFPPPGAPTGFVPMSPVRILDTRGTTGGHKGALGAGETWSLPVRGTAGVPADAAAVVVNLTGAGATADTFITAWRSGERMPATSNVNVVAQAAVPNLAVIGVGANGAISLFNSAGAAHAVADLVGYFREATTDTTALTSLVPSRLLDTRTGTGGRTGAFGPGTEFDLQITGRGGVPAGCAAAVLNVTAVGASSNTYLTVWPNGEGQPYTSSVNVGSGQTAANLVIAKLGADGKLRIRNDAGNAHVLVDVAGFYVSYFRNDEPVWTSKVVVGRDQRETPIFRSKITYVVFNPTWTIPPGILVKDKLPDLRRNPGALKRMNIRVLDRSGREVNPYSVNWNQYGPSRLPPYQFVQDPGPNLSLIHISEPTRPY